MMMTRGLPEVIWRKGRGRRRGQKKGRGIWRAAAIAEKEGGEESSSWFVSVGSGRSSWLLVPVFSLFLLSSHLGRLCAPSFSSSFHRSVCKKFPPGATGRRRRSGSSHAR